jgi:hypothetical protein
VKYVLYIKILVHIVNDMLKKIVRKSKIRAAKST